jgi:hypothetical protein
LNPSNPSPILAEAGSSARDLFYLGLRAARFNGDLHRIFHRIFEGHLDSKQAQLVGRFRLVRFHRPTQVGAER